MDFEKYKPKTKVPYRMSIKHTCVCGHVFDLKTEAKFCSNCGAVVYDKIQELEKQYRDTQLQYRQEKAYLEEKFKLDLMGDNNLNNPDDTITVSYSKLYDYIYSRYIGNGIEMVAEEFEDALRTLP